jgi:hypothetical protein
MIDRIPIKVFVSSPSDVGPERIAVVRIVQLLNREFSFSYELESVFWERRPLLASHHFQDFKNIPPPHSCDITVVILWSRMGFALPSDRFRGVISGKVPVTGTEWEFEDAMAGHKASGRPALLLYRKDAPIVTTLDNREKLEDQLNQKDLVEHFMKRWFKNPDGSYKAASRTFSTTTEFEEKLENDIRTILQERMTKGTEPAAPGAPIMSWFKGCPFRGLEVFEQEHAPIFFGRTRACNEVREVLVRRIEEKCAFILVLGASGSGKSSLVKAGLVPDLLLPGMVRDIGLCRLAMMKPSDEGGDLLAAMSAAVLRGIPELLELRYSTDRVAGVVRRDHAELVFIIEQGLDRAAEKGGLTEIASARLILVIDQLEEIFTLDSPRSEHRERFGDVVEMLARSGLVWVVATMRSDFFHYVAGVPALARITSGNACYPLTPPNGNEIGQMISHPARHAGIRFAVDATRGTSLDEELRIAAARDPGSLPLLEFTLQELWKRRTDTGELTFQAYRNLMGLEGAIGQRAQEELDRLPPEVSAVFPSVLRALVQVGQGIDGTVTARAIPIRLFDRDPNKLRLIEAFVAPRARLLIASGDDRGASIRVAHEALLTNWETARVQIAKDRDDLQLRARLEQAAALWEQSGDDTRLLGEGTPLLEAEALLDWLGDELEDGVKRFIEASRTRWKPEARDLRPDFFMGLALSLIFANFIPSNIISTGLQTIAFSDAAEVFIFISGYTAALVYGQPMVRRDMLVATVQIYYHAWQLYVAHIFIFMIYTAEVSYATLRLQTQSYSEELRLNNFLQEPHRAIIKTLLLQYQPELLGILPLYIVLLAFFPIVLLLQRRRPFAPLIFSFAIYLLTMYFGWEPKTYPDNDGWVFNPFAWQFLFIVGATAGYAHSAAQPSLPRWPWIPRAAIAVTVVVAVIKLSWLAHGFWDRIPALFYDLLVELANDKSDLSLLRLVSFFALALTVVHFMRRDSAILRHPLSKLVIACGQHSLHVFCLGILLSVLGRFILSSVSNSFLMELAVNIAGLALMIALAQLMSWYRKKSRPPAGSPVAQARMAS